MTPDELRALLESATAGPWSSHNSMGTGHLTSSAQDVALIVALRNHAEALLDVAERAAMFQKMVNERRSEGLIAYWDLRLTDALDRLEET